MIDPAWDGQDYPGRSAKERLEDRPILVHARPFRSFRRGCQIVANELNPAPLVALHPFDHELWQNQGGAPLFWNADRPRPGADHLTLLTDRSYDWEISNSRCGIHPVIPPVMSSITAPRNHCCFAAT